MSTERRLLIVQPYVAQYRADFFEALRAQLASAGTSVTIAAGSPAGAQAARGDEASLDGGRRLKRREWRFGPGVAVSEGSLRLARQYDGVILGLSGASLDALAAAACRGSRALGYWGHVGSYVAPGNAVDLAIERHLMRRADHVFAYTDDGAAIATAVVGDADKVTSVGNTANTEALERAAAAVTPREAHAFAREIGVAGRACALFIGGLDASKRIGFLAAAVDAAVEIDPRFTLLVAGEGVDAPQLRDAERRGAVVMLGRADDRRKALLSKVCGCVAMPGRVGLVAVDALVLGLPVVTTPWPFHGPEVQYLTEGQSRITADDDPHAFAHAMVAAATENRTHAAWRAPSLDHMVENFASGVSAMFSRAENRRRG